MLYFGICYVYAICMLYTAMSMRKKKKNCKVLEIPRSSRSSSVTDPLFQLTFTLTYIDYIYYLYYNYPVFQIVFTLFILHIVYFLYLSYIFIY